ncbi:12549_t:CDS:2 [Entrophospora sp. SA101]|nr:15277_t:CDS:2 [Entrophospora sp. SA101]CAJ0840236.1 12549_t:CDS:2 [Entrophospora sp. SA101]
MDLLDKPKLGHSIFSGEDIVISNESLAGISNYFTFMWPTDVEEGIIKAYEIPNYGSPKIYSIFDIKKLLKNNNISQPNAIISDPNNTSIRMENDYTQINPSIQKLKTSEVRFILKDKNLGSPENKLVIKERLDQHSSYDLLYNLMLLDDNDINMKNITAFNQHKQIFGKKGGGKRINLEVVEKSKKMFLTGNVEKIKNIS